MPGESWNWRNPIVLALTAGAGLVLAVAAYQVVYAAGTQGSVIDSTSAGPETPVDSATVASRLLDCQKAQLQKVADAMLDIYHTMAEMRTLDPVGIETGPHDINVTLCRENDIDWSIIYLYQILPYVNTSEAEAHDFIFGSSFADFRRDDDIEMSRDPFYAGWEEDPGEYWQDGGLKDNGPYILSWATPLSNLGNHQSILIYDGKRDRIWVTDQIDVRTTDPGLEGVPNSQQRTNNRNSIDHIPNRPALDVLRDIVRWYRTLEKIPGGDGDEGPAFWEYEPIKRLYQKYGWPDQFDGDAFEIDQARWYAAVKAKYHAEEPVRKVEALQEGLRNVFGRERTAAQKRLAAASNRDDRWLARFQIWKAEKFDSYFVQQAKSAKDDAERLCPNGICQRPEHLPLWEVEQLRVGLKGARGEVTSEHAHPRHARKRLKVLEEAHAQSQADAERLCPVETFESATGLKSLGGIDNLAEIARIKEKIAEREKELQEFAEWAEQVPAEALQARDAIAGEIGSRELALSHEREHLERSEKWYAEHGNDE